jgi:tRNA-specific 2-thiouridylase
VDSSVCAHLLREQGHDLIGVTIKTWSNDECRDEKSKGCCSIRDIDDARSVARKLNIPYYVMDLSSDFKTDVIGTFVDEYFKGRTPNPCIECNRHIKFGILLDKAREIGAEYVATGHYARKGYDEAQGRWYVREAVDPSKDQTYVLFGQTQEQLARTLLPVGELTKKEVRAIAEKIGLRVHDKPDSQEICFVKKDYGTFVREAAPERLPGEGNFVDGEGCAIGTHAGSHLYTIGQRKRIGLTHIRPYFVTAIDAATNTVTVGREEDLYAGGMRVRRVNWLLNPRTGPIEVKIRSRHDKTPAEIMTVDGSDVTVRFGVRQKAVTPGQAAVFYEGDRVLGGGWIESASDY